MKHHERESFIYIVRSGKVKIANNIYLHPPKIEQIIESYEKYNEMYEQCLNDEIMTSEEMDVWMKENLIWTKAHEIKVENLKKDIEECKIEMFNTRQNTKGIKILRARLRSQEILLNKHIQIKHSEDQNTCEGISEQFRLSWLLSNSVQENNEPIAQHKLKNIRDNIISIWQDSILSESQYRELARNEPWRSLWSMSKSIKIKLFLNKKDEDLTINQKNLIVWSQIYDNIQESIDYPGKDVIEDDDMLDGWMIIQHKKQEKEKLAKIAEEITSNPKIKNSSEVFIMAHNQEHANNIYNINDPSSRKVIAQRSHAIATKGALLEQELPDVQQNIQIQQAQALKNTRSS